MKEQRFESSVDTATFPAPPNFEDEVTLVTARRVVPLEKIEAKVRRRRRWVLGGAFALAMMLGATSALVASYIRLRNGPEAAREISEVEVEAGPMAVAEPVSIDSTDEENPEEVAVPFKPKRESPVKRSAPLISESDSSHPRDGRRLSEEEELRRIREAVLLDEWQERRQRRVERRNRGNGGGRDLSHLDEIFEGRRRP